METQESKSAGWDQARVWIALLLLANLFVAVMALVKLGEIADALGA